MATKEEPEATTASPDQGEVREVIGSAALRPVFLGNLSNTYAAEEVTAIFEGPQQPVGGDTVYAPIPVDRIDLKRGYCFVFLKDAVTQQDKEQAELFVAALNGMQVNNVSSSLRAEFARGDGRVKRKEDERRRNIAPSETLFVVNFHEETTKKEDLQMLFEPFGELTRIEMKRNYAFVQFRSIAEATKAKETTNGGKLDQSVLTVEYVAQKRTDGSANGNGGGGGSNSGRGDRDRNRNGRDRGGRDRGDRGGGGDRRRNDDRRGNGNDDRRFDDRRDGGGGRRDDRDRFDDRRDNRGNDRDRGGGDNRGNDRDNRGGDNRGNSRDGRGGDNRGNDRDNRDRSPPRDGGHRGGGRARSRSRSRSRSPPRFGRRNSRSPPREQRLDDRDGGRDRRGGSPGNNRGRSQERDSFRGGDRGDRGRGYRP